MELEHLEQLNACLVNFKAIEVSDITEKYVYYPDYVRARLGSGSYGEAFRMASTDPREPMRVVKVIPKARVTKNSLQIQHLCAELAVTGYFTHSNLNKRVGLFHNTVNIFIVLELVEGTRPDAQTRLAQLFAYHHPTRLASLDRELENITKLAQDAGYADVNDYLDQSGRMRTILAECGAKKETPVSTDLFNLIVAMKRVPDGLAKIIIKQALSGLRFLHQNNVVHRDVKTENLVLGVSRTSELIRDAEGNITGVKFTEEVHAKVIDFGLVKYMKLGAFPNVMSPGMFNTPTTRDTNVLLSDPRALDFDDDVVPAPTAQPQGFYVDVTPCGTELYCSLEVIDGILKSGVGKSKWRSTSLLLPKMDVYGVGTMLFCCANGRPPYKPPKDPYRPVSREERIKQVLRLISSGPVFSANVAADTQEFVRLLMENDPNKRPTAEEALRHPYLAGVHASRFVYVVHVNGTFSVVSATDQLQAALSAVSDATDDDEDVRQGEDDIMAAVRGIEDAGDASGKERGVPPPGFDPPA